MEALQSQIIELLIVVITGFIGMVTTAIMTYLKKKGVITKLEAHKEIAKIAVSAIEQTYKQLKGKDKFDLAKQEIVELANKKGLKITEAEINLLIHDAVREMNKSIKESM